MVPPLHRSRHQTHFNPQIRGPEEIGNERINRQEDLVDQLGMADRSFLLVQMEPPDFGRERMFIRLNPPRNHQLNPLHNALSTTYPRHGMVQTLTTSWSRTSSCYKAG